MANELPPGFVLDAPSAGLPSGYVLDLRSEGQIVGPQDQQPSTLDRLGQAGVSTAAGVAQGASLGFYDELAAGLATPFIAGTNAVTGADRPEGMGDIPDFLGRTFQDTLAGQREIFQGAQESDPIAYGAGEIGGGIALGGGMAGSSASLMRGVAPKILPMTAAGAGEGAFYGGAYGYGSSDAEDFAGRMQDAGWGALWGALTGGVIGGAGGAVAARSARNSAPALSDLETQASALYNAARKNGVTASPQATTQLADDFTGLMRSSGLITPKGRIASSYSKISDAFNLVQDYAGQAMTVPQMQTVRRLLRAAAGSADEQERYFARDLLNHFDDFVSPLAPQIREANGIYQRVKKADLIETLVESARNRTATYSQSGFENAMRREFIKLNDRIIRGKERGFSPEEVAAIEHVAKGGPFENFFRAIGRWAPNGPVAASAAFGVPAAAGTLLGSPGLGVTLGMGAMGAGAGSRAIATAGTRNNVAIAEALMRAGPAGLPKTPTIANQAVTDALIAAAANQNDAPSAAAQALRQFLVNGL